MKAYGYWYRYSNTLLVSLNNRISIRQVSPGGRALLTSRTRPASNAEDRPSIVNLEMKKSSYAFEGRKQSGESVEDDGREKVVIGKCCGVSFPVFFRPADLINRYRMMDSQRQDVMGNNYGDWIDHQFLYRNMWKLLKASASSEI